VVNILITKQIVFNIYLFFLVLIPASIARLVLIQR
jgi:hypothetical protein